MGWHWKRPWKHIPPWVRPGWYFGKGWCWKQYGFPPVSDEDEVKYLEELRKYLTEVVLKEIDERLKELKSKQVGRSEL
ncbi:DUF5320 domain-containing protein [Thermosphaera sp.]